MHKGKKSRHVCCHSHDGLSVVDLTKIGPRSARFFNEALKVLVVVGREMTGVELERILLNSFGSTPRFMTFESTWEAVTEGALYCSPKMDDD